MVTFTGDVPPLVSHSAHPEHALKLVDTGSKLFQCDGCKQLGQERRYRCEQCDFDLHICCARQPAGFEHPMFQGRALTFFHRRPDTPPGSAAWCDVCSDLVLGFMYHSREHNLHIHPPCDILPELHRATGHECGLCGQDGHRGRGFAYRLQNDDGEFMYHHVACMMEACYCRDGEEELATLQIAPTAAELLATPQIAPTAAELATPQIAPTAAEQATPQIAPTAAELATPQIAPMRRRYIFYKVVSIVAKVSYAVITMDPVEVIAAIAEIAS